MLKFLKNIKKIIVLLLFTCFLGLSFVDLTYADKCQWVCPGKGMNTKAGSETVKALQQIYNQYAMNNGLPTIKVDGKYGKETENAIKAFQKNWNETNNDNIAEDGLLGPVTRAKLEAVTGDTAKIKEEFGPRYDDLYKNAKENIDNSGIYDKNQPLPGSVEEGGILDGQEPADVFGDTAGLSSSLNSTMLGDGQVFDLPAGQDQGFIDSIKTELDSVFGSENIASNLLQSTADFIQTASDGFTQSLQDSFSMSETPGTEGFSGGFGSYLDNVTNNGMSYSNSLTSFFGLDPNQNLDFPGSQTNTDSGIFSPPDRLSQFSPPDGSLSQQSDAGRVGQFAAKEGSFSNEQGNTNESDGLIRYTDSGNLTASDLSVGQQSASLNSGFVNGLTNDNVGMDIAPKGDMQSLYSTRDLLDSKLAQYAQKDILSDPKAEAAYKALEAQRDKVDQEIQKHESQQQSGQGEGVDGGGGGSQPEEGGQVTKVDDNLKYECKTEGENDPKDCKQIPETKVVEEKPLQGNLPPLQLICQPTVECASADPGDKYVKQKEAFSPAKEAKKVLSPKVKYVQKGKTIKVIPVKPVKIRPEAKNVNQPIVFVPTF